MTIYPGARTILGIMFTTEVNRYAINTNTHRCSNQSNRNQYCSCSCSFILITHNLYLVSSGTKPRGRKTATKETVATKDIQYIPFLAPWKKNLTTKTCNPAIETIINASVTLKLKIRLSVLRTVLKFRFSRVRKYFWFREMVDSCAESLKIDSSSAEACSGLAPCREGS